MCQYLCVCVFVAALISHLFRFNLPAQRFIPNWIIYFSFLSGWIASVWGGRRTSLLCYSIVWPWVVRGLFIIMRYVSFEFGASKTIKCLFLRKCITPYPIKRALIVNLLRDVSLCTQTRQDITLFWICFSFGVFIIICLVAVNAICIEHNVCMVYIAEISFSFHYFPLIFCWNQVIYYLNTRPNKHVHCLQSTHK